MYLVERAFKTPESKVDPETGILPLIEKNRAEALKKAGVVNPSVPDAAVRQRVTDEMIATKEIVFCSSHAFTKNGVFNLRTVALFEDEVAYKKHREATVGVPENISEPDLDMSFDDLEVLVICEDIKRK